jgi:hypothetical protein
VAIDSDITIANLVTEALKNAGRTAPTAGQISDATAYQFRRVKSDIALKSSRHPSLITQAVTASFIGLQKYDWPTDAQYIRSVSVLDGPEEWHGVAQSGATANITLALAMDVSDSATLIGKYIITLGGTGSLQIRQIVGWNNSTKVITVQPNWVTNPAVGTTYMVTTNHQRLYLMDKSEWDFMKNPGASGSSYAATLVGREIWLEHTFATSNRSVLWWDYYAHMDLLDNAGAVMLRHIRDYYSLWSQGLSAWLCQRYDEDRYQAELGVYDNLLTAYESESSHITQMNQAD